MQAEILYDLKVEHTQRNPVFVIGNPRSGTSILIRLLRKYLKVNFGTESQFIIRYYHKLKYYDNLHKEDNIKKLIDDISLERCFRRWEKRFGFVLDNEMVFQQLEEWSYRGALMAIFRQFADYHQMDRWGDKTPEYIMDLEILNDLFPEGQYIHIIRDGRDVALSNFQTAFGAKNYIVAALDWKHKINLAEKFGRSQSNHHFIEIRYEDLIQKPMAVFQKLIEFLGIKDETGVLSNFIKEHIRMDLRSDNSSKWKHKMTKKQIIDFERIAYNYLQKYGYETISNGAPKPKYYELLYWKMDNFVRKRLMKGYWEDNIYKLRLKFNK